MVKLLNRLAKCSYVLMIILAMLMAGCKDNISENGQNPKEASFSKEGIPVAIANDIDASCQGITDDQVKSICSGNFLLNKARNEKDAILCDYITVQDLKSSCKDEVNIKVALGSKDESACEKVVDTSRKSYCTNNLLLNKAVTTQDKAICSKISDANIKTACLNQFQ